MLQGKIVIVTGGARESVVTRRTLWLKPEATLSSSM